MSISLFRAIPLSCLSTITVPPRLPGGFPLDPRPIIIIEGVLVLADETIRDICDLRIFVDTSDELRLDVDVGEISGTRT